MPDHYRRDRILKPSLHAQPRPEPEGTGTECTGYAICDMSQFGVKSAIAHKYLRPTMALVDPLATRSLPRSVLAASGFDVLCHAAESYTARPYTSRDRTPPGTDRPLAQGANPWSDIGCREALRVAGMYFERALRDNSDLEVRVRAFHVCGGDTWGLFLRIHAGEGPTLVGGHSGRGWHGQCRHRSASRWAPNNLNSNPKAKSLTLTLIGTALFTVGT